MKRLDFIIIGILILVSVTGVIISHNNEQGAYAEVYVNGNLYGKYDLTNDYMLDVAQDNGCNNKIIISNGSIHMQEANCPDRICINQGRIDKNKESICCAPNGILIIVHSIDEGEYDAITR